MNAKQRLKRLEGQDGTTNYIALALAGLDHEGPEQEEAARDLANKHPLPELLALLIGRLHDRGVPMPTKEAPHD
ncbi:hypothetical protein [Desulfurivibrio dismutans]|uniref:hypothetical protein n=1 Tax=Desulfurivibrio dismutans TaxID=1398908 RepID=UPI0023DCB100|nr:hypothetical protein [Desulfurivibrio alkaliphilus]MDF1613658.1 hypothetical protein [Desulfurivibrio alkaliphilus]